MAQQDSKQAWDAAIESMIKLIAEQENITSVDLAIDSMKATGGQYASPSVHAMYLQKVPESKGFTRKDVSIYLAELGDDAPLLSTYFQLVHFGGLSIEDSLRLFYTELRLIPLMNKNLLDILLGALAIAFKTNGGLFSGDVEDSVRIYHAMIMLNDSLHNKNFAGRSRQTLASFMQIINERKANKVQNFEESDMRRIYDSIQKTSLYEKKCIQSTMDVAKSNVSGDSNGNDAPKSYSKYGKSKGGQNDFEKYESVSNGKGNDGDYDDEPPKNSGGCCIVM